MCNDLSKGKTTLIPILVDRVREQSRGGYEAENTRDRRLEVLRKANYRALQSVLIIGVVVEELDIPVGYLSRLNGDFSKPLS